MAADIKSIARRTYEELLPKADLNGLAEVIHPDCISHETPPGTGSRPQGLEGTRQTALWLNRVFSDLRWDIHKLIAEGDTVAVFSTLTGRHTGELMGLTSTNRPVAFRQMAFIRFQDGKGIEFWAVRDDLSLMRQLGALPQPGQ